MATDINCVFLVGRLTRESELRYTNAGTAVSRFSLAVNRRKRTGDKWEDEVSFFDCVLWGKQAESLNPYLEKGRQVCVSGELRQNRWEQDGQSRSKVEVVVNNIEFFGSSTGQGNGGGSGRSNGGYQNQAPRPQASAAPSQRQEQPAAPEFNGPEDFDDSDIPF
ncbi:MAG: single-stranded DNA-binding protein [Spirochaetales bacterium]|jgi:single-strand DNA-binding protein|nr:single-stranded DNA-binding protein [Spirochaetales bacterium]